MNCKKWTKRPGKTERPGKELHPRSDFNGCVFLGKMAEEDLLDVTRV